MPPLFGAWLLLLLFLVYIQSWLCCLGAAAPWPACPVSEGFAESVQEAYSRIRVPVSACTVSFAASGSAGASSPGNVQLADQSMLDGVFNGSLGRPPAVQLVAGPAAGQTVTQLLIPPDGTLSLEGLLLYNVELISPIEDPSKALLPAAIPLPPGALLKIRDTVLFVSQRQLQEYIGFFLAVPQLPLLTDNATFLHIMNYTNPPFGVVEVRSITLIAPEAASIDGTPVAILQALDASSKAQQAQNVGTAAVARAKGDAYGIVSVTDTYVLGATNDTMIPLMQRIAGQQDTQVPLFVSISSNLSLAPHFWGSDWPGSRLHIRRPVIWAGSSWQLTSIDLGMQVGQIVLDGPNANVTLLNVQLENLAYGDASSLADAEGNSIMLSNQLWAFKYKRSEPRLVIRDVVLVLPEQRQIDNIIYWVNAFNSDLEFWRNSTKFLRDTLKYTVIRYSRGKVPGEYIIIQAVKKDQLMNNITYTTTPKVSPPLPLPFDPSIHQRLADGSTTESVVGSIKTVEDLVVTLWNQRTASCNRRHVLLPDKQIMSWAPVKLNLTRVSEDVPAEGQQVGAAGQQQPAAGQSGTWGLVPHTTLLEPLPSVQGIFSQHNGTTTLLGDAGNSISDIWPDSGGEVIECPVMIQGTIEPQKIIDLAFGRDLLHVVRMAMGDTSGTPLLEISQLTLVQLPQGANATDGDLTGNTPAAAPAVNVDGAAGGIDKVAWVSKLAPDAYTHLLWCIARDINIDDGQVLLSNVTLLLPAPEAQTMSAAAQAAAQAAAPEGIQFTMLYPTGSGPLTVTYKDITFPATLPGAAAQASATASADSLLNSKQQKSSGLRHLMQQQQPPSSPAPSATDKGHRVVLCIGSMAGAGFKATNLCLVEQDPNALLSPGYVWPGHSSGNDNWPGWKVAVVVLAVVLPVLAAAGCAGFAVLKRRRAYKAAVDRVSKYAGIGLTASLTSSTGSNRKILAAPPAGVDDTKAVADSSGETSSGSSAFVRLYTTGLAKRLRECCPGSSPDTTAASTATAASAASTLTAAAAQTDAAAAVPTVAAPGAAEVHKKPSILRRSCSHSRKSFQCPREGSSSGASDDQHAGTSAVVVNLGEQLGQMAALHKQTLDSWGGDSDSSVRAHGCSGISSMGVLLGPSSNRGQQPGVAGRGNTELCWQRLQQGEGSTVQRLTQAISSVSAEMHFRRLGGGIGNLHSTPPQLGFTSASSLARQDITAGGGVVAAISATIAEEAGYGPAAAATAAADAHLRPHAARRRSYHMTRHSIEEEPGALAVTAVPVPVSGKPSRGGWDLQALESEIVPDATQYLRQPFAASAPAQHSPGAGQELPPAATTAAGAAAAVAAVAAALGKAPSLARISAPAAGVGVGAGEPIEAAPAGRIRAPPKVSRSFRQYSRQKLQSTSSSSLVAAGSNQLQLHEVVGSGTFGVVYRATWRGIPAAVKVMQLPNISDVSVGNRNSRREQMAVMEAALGSSLSHPNIVQVYTYMLRPLSPVAFDDHSDNRSLLRTTTTTSGSTLVAAEGSDTDGASPSGTLRKGSGHNGSGIAPVIGYELQLVMEYFPMGSLRAAIDDGVLDDRLTNRPHYLTVLSLALGVARAMQHLHSEGIVHGDLKAGNVLLKLEAGYGNMSWLGSGIAGVWQDQIAAGLQQTEQLVAKVADFGLACRLADQDTHISGVHRGTLNHMSPELLVHGHASRASDVYAFGILMWEMATGLRAFSDVPKAMLGATVVRDRARPEWPEGNSMFQAVAAAAAAASDADDSTSLDVVPRMAYRELAEACWAHEPRNRPAFEEVCDALEHLLAQEQQRLMQLALMAHKAQQQHQYQHQQVAAPQTPTMSVVSLPQQPSAATSNTIGAPSIAPATSGAPSAGAVVQGSVGVVGAIQQQLKMQQQPQSTNVLPVGRSNSIMRPQQSWTSPAAGVNIGAAVPGVQRSSSSGCVANPAPQGRPTAAAAAACSPFDLLKDATWGASTDA